MDRWIGKLAIVTGASSGIGEAICKSLVRSGVNVLGLARREDRLESLKKELSGCKGLFYFAKCDVQNEADIVNAFDYAEKKLGGVDILINNAGILKAAPFQETKIEDLRAVMDVNLIAAVTCIREALKSLRKSKKEGHIFNINSIAGLDAKIASIPINIYPASKFAMRAMADSLKMEIKQNKDKIRLTTIYPGLVNTEIIELSGLDTEAIFNLMPALVSEDIANGVMYALGAPPHVQVDDLVITAVHNKE
ncbi:farnesol dehydrogenase-like [Chelonus insularis]|uniref:farnesol dehydrogenase-like n=1 Tax=Chelonus insularis TaxID=460826 RepID=UPI0015888386|nr:farnesol dehydrogenase-like [Chelonus insularis]